MNLNDYDFEPLPKPRRPRKTQAEYLKQKAESRIQKFRKLKAKWDEEELAYLNRRAKELAEEIAIENERQRIDDEREAARERAEAEMKKVRDYYSRELAKEAKRNTIATR